MSEKKNPLNPSVKEVLDLRLARGEISEAEYQSLLRTITSEDQRNKESSTNVLTRLGRNATKAFDKLLGTEKIDFKLLNNLPSNDQPLKVTNELSVYVDHLSYKNEPIDYETITGLSLSVIETNTSTTSGMPLGMNCKSKLTIVLRDRSRNIEINTKTGSSWEKKSLIIRRAYDYIRDKTYRQRMVGYLKKLEEFGYIEIDGAKLFRNGDIEKRNIRTNLNSARQKGMLRKGTTYGGWLPRGLPGARGNKPNEMIIGDNGTGFFDRRIKFEINQDQDVLFSIIEHLSEGKEI